METQTFKTTSFLLGCANSVLGDSRYTSTCLVQDCQIQRIGEEKATSYAQFNASLPFIFPAGSSVSLMG
jgi:hypothetical protein